MPFSTSTQPPVRKLKIASIAFVVILGVGLGGVLGWLVGSTLNYQTQDEIELLITGKRLIHDGFDEGPEGIVKQIIGTVNADKIREFLRMAVSQPHIAGTDGDHHLATFIHDQWIVQGLDNVQMVPYEVLLSFADENQQNTVELLGDSGDVLYRSILPPLPPEDDWSSFSSYPYPYYGYAPNGTVVGDPVFVNYGSEGDYDYLAENGINISGKIAIAKHGDFPCEKKVSLADKHGAIGLLVYADPADVALNGTDEKSVYPHTWWLPNTGIIRSTARETVGDPLTPDYPSIENVYRSSVNVAGLPKIPAQPISAVDAKEIIGRMGGLDVPELWKGALDIPYRLGPGFGEGFKSLKLKMSVYNRLKTATNYNVVATIIGEDEPDRYVLMGNHRDAWVKGAVDPGSGTAVLMELTRTLGEIRRKGWRPRRTLMFCSWGGEEFGLIGSTEWVEEHLLKLQERAVSYINVDTCVAGDAFDPMISPTLKHAAFKVSKLIPDPDNTEESLYDSWHRKMKRAERVDKNDMIIIPTLGLSSDFAPFAFYAGIPVMDISFQKLTNTGISVYPAYHTSFETIFYLEKFLDPHFRRHVGCAQFTGTMMHYLSDTALLPFNFEALVAEELGKFELLTDYDIIFEEKNISLNPLKRVLQDLQQAAATWESYLEKANKHNPYVLRALNDHMMLMHKAFLNRIGKNESNSWFFRHGTERSVFGILDSIEVNAWYDIELHLSNLLIMMQQLVGMLGRNPYTI